MRITILKSMESLLLWLTNNFCAIIYMFRGGYTSRAVTPFRV